MKISETQMNGLLGDMTLADEECLCSVYCMFLETGFFARSYNMTVGYISHTSGNRLICTKNTFGSGTGAAYRMSDLRRVKIKKDFIRAVPSLCRICRPDERGENGQNKVPACAEGNRNGSPRSETERRNFDRHS